MRVLQARTKYPRDLLAVGPGGLVAAGSSAFGARADVEVWDLASERVRFVYPTGDREPCPPAFTPDGRHLLVGGLDALTALDTATGQAVGGVALSVGLPAFALSARGDRLLAATGYDGTGAVECLALDPDLTSRRLWHDPPQTLRFFHTPAISPDGTRAAVVEHSGFDRPKETVQLRSAATGKVLVEIPHDPADPVTALAFTHDGARLLSRGRGRTVRVWAAGTGGPVGELVHTGRPYVTGVAVHPGGKAIAASRNDGAVWLWDPATLRPLKTLDWKAGKLVSVAFGPDGSVAAAGTEAGQVIVWDVDL